MYFHVYNFGLYNFAEIHISQAAFVHVKSFIVLSFMLVSKFLFECDEVFLFLLCFLRSRSQNSGVSSECIIQKKQCCRIWRMKHRPYLVYLLFLCMPCNDSGCNPTVSLCLWCWTNCSDQWTVYVHFLKQTTAYRTCFRNCPWGKQSTYMAFYIKNSLFLRDFSHWVVDFLKFLLLYSLWFSQLLLSSWLWQVYSECNLRLHKSLRNQI